jgi:hypothetical protein
MNRKVSSFSNSEIVRQEIDRVDAIYNKMWQGSLDLVAEKKPNNVPPLLLTKSADGAYAKDSSGNFIHRPGWCLSIASLIEQQAGQSINKEISKVLNSILQANSFLIEGKNYLPQRPDFRHFHLFVFREVSPTIPSKEEQQASITLAKNVSPELLINIPAARILLKGFIVAPDGTIILKAYPLDEHILTLRQNSETASKEIDQLFSDKNQGQSKRKIQADRLYHISLGRITEPLTPIEFKQLVDYLQKLNNLYVGEYSLKEAFMLTEKTSYFQDPEFVDIRLPFGG